MKMRNIESNNQKSYVTQRVQNDTSAYKSTLASRDLEL